MLARVKTFLNNNKRSNHPSVEEEPPIREESRSDTDFSHKRMNTLLASHGLETYAPLFHAGGFTTPWKVGSDRVREKGSLPRL